MYLLGLNDLEKRDFLELVNIVANSDGNFDESEKALMDSYRKEMNLNQEKYKIQNKKLDTIINELSPSTFASKRKIFLEILALAYADEKYLQSEEKVIKYIAKSFNISEKDYNEFLKWIIDMKELYRRANELIEK